MIILQPFIQLRNWYVIKLFFLSLLHLPRTSVQFTVECQGFQYLSKKYLNCTWNTCLFSKICTSCYTIRKNEYILFMQIYTKSITWVVLLNLLSSYTISSYFSHPKCQTFFFLKLYSFLIVYFWQASKIPIYSLKSFGICFLSIKYKLSALWKIICIFLSKTKNVELFLRQRSRLYFVYDKIQCRTQAKARH